MPLSEADKGWVAGILDLKGYVIRKNNKDRATVQLVLMVETKNASIISRLSALCGQQVAKSAQDREVKNWMRRGCNEHCPSAHIHHDVDWQMPPTSRWTVTGAAMALVLYTVLPYMQGNLIELEATMQECVENVVLRGPGSGASLAAMRRLASMGWQIPDTLIDVVLSERAAMNAKAPV